MYPCSGFVPGGHPPKPPFGKPPFGRPLTKGRAITRLLRRVLRFREGFSEGVSQWAVQGGRVLRMVLRRGSKKRLSRGHLKGRKTPFREYDLLRVRPTRGGCATDSLNFILKSHAVRGVSCRSANLRRL